MKREYLKKTIPVNCYDIINGRHKRIITIFIKTYTIFGIKFMRLKTDIPYIKNASYDGEILSNDNMKVVANSFICKYKHLYKHNYESIKE